MSSTFYPGDTQGEPTCAGCGEPLPIGVARFPTPDGAMHDVCRGVIAGPDGLLGELESTDRVEVRVRGEWIDGIVEHVSGIENGDYVVRVGLDEVVPGGVADHVDVCTTYVGQAPRGPLWTNPVGYDIIPGWDLFSTASESVLPAKFRTVGEVAVRRPTG